MSSPGFTGGSSPPAQVGLAPDLIIAPSGAQLSITLAPEPTSCREARGAVRAFCVEQSLGQLADDAELLTSELVANAVEHSLAPIQLTASAAGSGITVSVADGNSHLVRSSPRSTEELSERGRGLLVVEQLAGAWGTTPHDGGKSVWFRLP